MENGGSGKDHYTIGEVVARLRKEFPTLSVSKVRYLERRRLINLTRTAEGTGYSPPRTSSCLSTSSPSRTRSTSHSR